MIMAEIKYLKCGTRIQLDKSEYDALLNEIEKENMAWSSGREESLSFFLYQAFNNSVDIITLKSDVYGKRD